MARSAERAASLTSPHVNIYSLVGRTDDAKVRPPRLLQARIPPPLSLARRPLSTEYLDVAAG